MQLNKLKNNERKKKYESIVVRVIFINYNKNLRCIEIPSIDKSYFFYAILFILSFCIMRKVSIDGILIELYIEV